ncbi:unnamed protein product [Gordionus sp. m RMFG-2023]
MNLIASTSVKQHFFRTNLFFNCKCALCCPSKIQGQISNSTNEYCIDMIDECLPKYDFHGSNLDFKKVQIYQEDYFNRYLTAKSNLFVQNLTSNALPFPASKNIVYNMVLQSHMNANMLGVDYQNILARDSLNMVGLKITYEMGKALESGDTFKKYYVKYDIVLAMHWHRMALLSKALNYKADQSIYKNKCLDILDAAYPLTQLDETRINRSIIGVMRKFCLTC